RSDAMATINEEQDPKINGEAARTLNPRPFTNDEMKIEKEYKGASIQKYNNMAI
ncbi:41700_t:CDS:2, partial [Gigaspora margarita]